jgi:hypothetical protein
VVGRIATYRIYRVRAHATNACSRAALALLQSGDGANEAYFCIVCLFMLAGND